MSTTAITPNSSKSVKLDVAAVRADLARSYNPSGALELMLITQMAQTWIRLQDAYDVDRRYRADRDMLAVITTKPSEFRAVQGYVRDCERAWNHAKANLEKEQRKRLKENSASTKAARADARPEPLRETVQQPLPTPATPMVASASSRRE